MNRRIALVSLLVAVFASALAAETAELNTLDGDRVRPLDAGDGKFAVVVFITTDCPIANAFMPEISRLTQLADELGGKITLAHVDWDLSLADARKHAEDYSIRAPVVIDREHQLVKQTHATVTPEAVVLDREGSIVYQGKINDLFVDYGERRRQASRHYLRDAMEAVAKGEKPPTASVEPIGCFIPER